MEELLQWLCAIHPLSPECLDYLRKTIRTRHLKQGQLILQPGEVCENIYFIKKGLLRCYYLVKGKEVIDWFFWETDTVVSIDSFNDQKPGEDFIEAVEVCEVFYISHAQLEHVFSRYIEFNVIGRILYNKYLRIWHGQTRLLRKLSAIERYNALMERQPEAILRVPLRYLASYLNMKPETLSRIRARKQ